jgi:transposase
MLVDKKSHLPIYFRAVGGDIADNSTLKTTIQEVKKLGASIDNAVLDAGFSSKQNLKILCAEEIDFITRLSRTHGVFFELVDSCGIQETSFFLQKYGERFVFISQIEREIYGHKMFANIVLDPHKRANEMSNIAKKPPCQNATNEQWEEFNKKLKYAGYIVFLSKKSIEKSQVLPSYYTRQTIEQLFGFAKSNNSLLPLRVHSNQSINGYLFLVFLSLIIYVTMRAKLQPKINMDKAFLTLRSLKVKIYDDEMIIQEPNKKTKDVLKSLSVTMPTKLGV